VLVPLIALAYILAVVRIPYFVFQPGPAEDVLPLIHVQGQTVYPTKGHLLLTSISFFQPNVYQAFRAWLDSTQSLVPERDLLAPGQTQEQEQTRALSQMDQSKIDASFVVLMRYAGYPKKHGKGALIEAVEPGAPADGKLFSGDVITAINGKPVTTAAQVGPPIVAAGIGHVVQFTVQSGGKTHTVGIAPARLTGIAHPAIGISVVDSFPFPLTIDSGSIGGPSAGLMWSLGLTDLLTPGDMTGGRKIAGTGTIDLNGQVGPIGGIQEKVVAAERAGAVVFFAPAGEAADARSVAHHITVVPVNTYQDALIYLGQR